MYTTETHRKHCSLNKNEKPVRVIVHICDEIYHFSVVRENRSLLEEKFKKKKKEYYRGHV